MASVYTIFSIEYEVLGTKDEGLAVFLVLHTSYFILTFFEFSQIVISIPASLSSSVTELST